MKCDEDCFNCPYPDCIVDQTDYECKRYRQTERYYHLKSKGICASCGKPKDDPAKTYCISCRNRFHGYQKRLIMFRTDAGVCHKCGRKLDDKRYKTCAICRKRNMLSVRKYQEKRRLENANRTAGTPG